MLPSTLEETIARRLMEYGKRISHLERLEGGGGGVSPFFHPHDMGISFGGPGLGNYIPVGSGATTGFQCWDLSSAGIESVQTQWQVPLGVTVDDVTVYAAMQTAAGGNIRNRMAFNSMAIGELATNQVLILQTEAVPAVALTIFSFNVVPTITISPGDVLSIHPGRQGTDVADTAAGDMALLGVRINTS